MIMEAKDFLPEILGVCLAALFGFFSSMMFFQKQQRLTLEEKIESLKDEFLLAVENYEANRILFEMINWRLHEYNAYVNQMRIVKNSTDQNNPDIEHQINEWNRFKHETILQKNDSELRCNEIKSTILIKINTLCRLRKDLKTSFKDYKSLIDRYCSEYDFDLNRLNNLAVLDVSSPFLDSLEEEFQNFVMITVKQYKQELTAEFIEV